MARVPDLKRYSMGRGHRGPRLQDPAWKDRKRAKKFQEKVSAAAERRPVSLFAALKVFGRDPTGSVDWRRLLWDLLSEDLTLEPEPPGMPEEGWPPEPEEEAKAHAALAGVISNADANEPWNEAGADEELVAMCSPVHESQVGRVLSRAFSERWRVTALRYPCGLGPPGWKGGKVRWEKTNSNVKVRMAFGGLLLPRGQSMEGLRSRDRILELPENLGSEALLVFEVSPLPTAGLRKAIAVGDVDEALTQWMAGCKRLDGGTQDLSVLHRSSEDLVILSELCLQRNRIREATLVLQSHLEEAGPMSAKYFNRALARLGQRSEWEEVKTYMEVGEITGRGEKEAKYYNHFSKLTAMEFLQNAQFSIENARQGYLCSKEGCVITGLMARVNPRGNLQLVFADGSLLPPHRLTKGDSVLLSQSSGDDVDQDPMEGEVKDLPDGHNSIVVRLFGIVKQNWRNNEVLRKADGQTYRLDKVGNRVAYERQLMALAEVLEEGGGGWRSVPMDPVLRAIVCAGFDDEALAVEKLHEGEERPTPEALLAYQEPLDPQTRPGSCALREDLFQSLNNSQRQAVSAGATRRVALVQGPPGTGKTHTAARLMIRWLEDGLWPILAVAESNMAVDNLLEALLRSGVSKVVRLGRPEVVREDLLNCTLSHILAMEEKREAGNAAYWQHDDDMAENERNRNRINRVTREAAVVCSTCAGAGVGSVLDDVSRRFGFKAVLVDEASQATEPAVLVPLLRGSPRATMVGDHRQLPPTVISHDAHRRGLSLSLFERLVNRGVRPLLLEAQYRMHPALACYPSYAAYEGRLHTGVNREERREPKGFNWPLPGVPMAFVPVAGREEQMGTSYQNSQEAEALVNALRKLMSGANAPTGGQVGVITPYAAQARLLRQKLPPSVEVSSVDGFQGREKEVVLVSACRANQKGEVGFLNDRRRLNVTLTRARRGLLVFGHDKTLKAEKSAWWPWLEWAERVGCVVGKEPQDGDGAKLLQTLDRDAERNPTMNESPGGVPAWLGSSTEEPVPSKVQEEQLVPQPYWPDIGEDLAAKAPSAEAVALASEALASDLKVAPSDSMGCGGGLFGDFWEEDEQGRSPGGGAGPRPNPEQQKASRREGGGMFGHFWEEGEGGESTGAAAGSDAGAEARTVPGSGIMTGELEKLARLKAGGGGDPQKSAQPWAGVKVGFRPKGVGYWPAQEQGPWGPWKGGCGWGPEKGMGKGAWLWGPGSWGPW